MYVLLTEMGELLCKSNLVELQVVPVEKCNLMKVLQYKKRMTSSLLLFLDYFIDSLFIFIRCKNSSG